MVCNSEGTDELPENGTQLPKHIEAEKWNNKLIRVGAFVGYSWTRQSVFFSFKLKEFFEKN
jgi:hypothetical protein